jgi:cytosine/adenosine deaminase-related metal-dependent hydrolase
MLDAVLTGGARALARRSGRLALGAVADMLSLNADHPTLAGKVDDQILDAWIFSVGDRLVDCVWSGGRKVVADGRHRLRDEIGQKFKATMRRLCER